MSRLLRLSAFIAALLLLPVLPFVTGIDWDASFQRAWDPPPSPSWIAMLAIGVLGLDIVLPVPSSAVCTLAGSELGAWFGTLACWLGLNLSAVAGYGLGRFCGRSIARRLASQDDLESLERLAGRWGAWLVVLMRPVPILAEASVLLMGLSRMSWRPFAVAAGLSNLVIAAAYGALGQFAAEREWLIPAALFSAVAPLLFTEVARRSLGKRPENWMARKDD